MSLRGGIIPVLSSKERLAKFIYEICFVLNIVTIFVFYEVKNVATVTAAMMFISSVILLITRRSRKIIIPYNVVWYGVFFLFAALSALWAEYFDVDNLSMLLRLAIILITSTSISIYVDNKDDLERLMSLFIFSVFVIVSIELIYTPFNMWATEGLGSNFSNSNSNEVAFWVFCAEMMAFYKAYVNNKKSCYLLVVLFLGFIILSGSRKALFMGIAGPVIMTIFSTYKKFYILRIILAMIIISAILYFVMTNEHAYQTVGRRINSMISFYIDDNVGSDSSLYMREYYINLAKQMFSSSPIVGKGFENFQVIIQNDYGVNGTYSHNNFLQLLSELGIIGFTIYYSFYVFCIVKLIRRVVKDKSRLALVFLTFFILLIVGETGIVSCYSKYCQLVIAMSFTATYVGIDDGRKYKYMDNPSISKTKYMEE